METLAETLSPVIAEERPPESPERSEPEVGIALALSGGGYRAMLFHLGSLWRLNEAGLLQELKRISCVSGGSITGATLGLHWNELRAGGFSAGVFQGKIVNPVRKLARRTIDQGAILGGIFLPGTICDRVVAAYREHLFGDATLQDLPDDPPRFIFNATNVQSGALWRFMKPAMRDWKVGEVKSPRVHLAVAVAASSAFPPVLSPLTMRVEPSDFTPGTEALRADAYRSEVVLTDGGVYDNLGLETIWKRYKTVFVSDAGGGFEPEPEPEHDWARHSLRINSLIDHQVRALRIRQVIGSLDLKIRTGAFWSSRSAYATFAKAHPSLVCPADSTADLAKTPTRLARMDDRRQERLINWGYAVTDAALRSHFDAQLSAPIGFPYPEVAI